MALVWRMYRLLVNLPNFSSYLIFETSVENMCCQIISADDIASGEVVRYKKLV